MFKSVFENFPTIFGASPIAHCSLVSLLDGHVLSAPQFPCHLNRIVTDINAKFEIYPATYRFESVHGFPFGMSMSIYIKG